MFSDCIRLPAWPRAMFLGASPSDFACLLGPVHWYLGAVGSSPSALARLLGTVLWYLGAAAASFPVPDAAST